MSQHQHVQAGLSRPDSGRRPVTLTIQQSLRTHRPADEVFAYVSDFNRAKEWRTEVFESRQSPPGLLIEGSTLHEESRILRLTIVTESVVDELEPGRRFTFQHVSGPFPVSGEYLVEPLGDDTVFTYTLHVELHGLWRLMAAYFRRSGAQAMAKSLRALQRRLAAETA